MTRHYAGIIKNDVVNGNGVCVSLFLQGCPIHCKGCHNEQDWDFNEGLELPDNYLEILDSAITANGLQRNFSLLGGEPFCNENLDLTLEILSHMRDKFPKIDICAWSGYTYETLISRNDSRIQKIFSIIDVLVDGPFQLENRDVTLKMRGSTNQRIIDMRSTLKSKEVVLKHYED